MFLLLFSKVELVMTKSEVRSLGYYLYSKKIFPILMKTYLYEFSTSRNICL